MKQNYDKSVSPKVWKSWKIVAPATATSAQIRQDQAGRNWTYVFHVQNFYVKQVARLPKAELSYGDAMMTADQRAKAQEIIISKGPATSWDDPTWRDGV